MQTAKAQRPQRGFSRGPPLKNIFALFAPLRLHPRLKKREADANRKGAKAAKRFFYRGPPLKISLRSLRLCGCPVAAWPPPRLAAGRRRALVAGFGDELRAARDAPDPRGQHQGQADGDDGEW